MLEPIRSGRKLGELQHGFTHAQQIDAHSTARAAASIAARSPAAIRASSTRAPPMPTNAAPAARYAPTFPGSTPPVGQNATPGNTLTSALTWLGPPTDDAGNTFTTSAP